MMNVAAREARNTIAEANSDGSPDAPEVSGQPERVCPPSDCNRRDPRGRTRRHVLWPRIDFLKLSVAKDPGATAFTRIPSRARVRLMFLLTLASAALAAV